MLNKDFTTLVFWGILLAMITYIIGWFIDVMEVDAAQYAAMTLEMLKRGNYLTFTDHGKDYLDKPPMIFWLSGLSMSVFGANNIAYRIPAFLATLLALYSTYRLARIYYSEQAGLLAALILATTQATFLINHDVRTDTNLMAFYIFSLWQLAEYLQFQKWKNLVLGFVGVGFAMLAKGPIGIVAPAMGIFGHLVVKKEWKLVFNPKWIVGIVITAIILLPMSYGLYTQFDLQPEKVVNGKTGVSGLRFFYWTQSFGRITGESSWDNNKSAFFLSHSTLWAFAPWSLFLVLGLLDKISDLIKFLRGKTHSPEFITLLGFILPFAALSLSSYQLPHYAFITYSLGAIITANYIIKTFYLSNTKWTTWLYRFQILLLFVVLGLVFYLVWVPFPYENKIAVVLYMAVLAAFMWGVFWSRTKHKLILSCTILIVGVNMILNSFFYPNMLTYQAGSKLGKAAKMAGANEGQLFSYEAGMPHSLNFYSNVLTQEIQDLDSLLAKKNCFVYADYNLLEKFRAARPDLWVIETADEYPVSMLKGKFLNPSTRQETLKKRVLIKL